MPYANPEDKKQEDRNYYQAHHYSIAGETGTHFSIQHPDGSTFKVPKKGLGTKTLDRIGRLPRAESLSLKPSIPHFPTGGPAKEEDAISRNDPALDTFLNTTVPVSSEPAESAGDLEHTAPVPEVAPYTLPGMIKQTKQFSDQLAGEAPPAEPTPDLPPLQDRGAVPNVRVAGMPDVSTPPLPKMPNLFGLGVGIGGFGGKIPGEDAVAEGLAEQGAAESQKNKAEAQIEQEKQVGLAKISADTQSMIQERKANSDKLFQDIMGSNIDPEHYWATRSTGQRISASIAMVLGGISVGINGGGENPALKNINAAIDRDIEAQKFNLGKKQTLLSHYMAETKDLVSAQQLVKADYLDITAAKLAQAAAEANDPIAIARSQTQVGQWRAQAFQLRSDIAYKQADLSMKGLDYQVKQMQLKMEMWQFEQNRNLMSHMFGQQGAQQPAQAAPAAEQTAGGIRGGVRIDPRALSMNKDWNGRAVQLDDGTFAFSRSNSEADKLRNFKTAVDDYQSALTQYADLARKHNGITGGGVLNPLSEDYGKAQGLHAYLVGGGLNKLQEISRMSEVELGEINKKIIPDITGPTKGDAAQAQLSEMQDILGRKLKAEFKNHSMTRIPGITADYTPAR